MFKKWNQGIQSTHSLHGLGQNYEANKDHSQKPQYLLPTCPSYWELCSHSQIPSRLMTLFLLAFKITKSNSQEI